jgi:hypothetical protein
LTARRHSPLLIVIAISLAGVVFRAPMLRTGFMVDDYAQLSMMSGTYPVQRAALQLFTFSNGQAAENQALRDAGFFPWWTHPALRVSLCRPLASALMWFDHWAFGSEAFFYHLHSAAWWLGMSTLWGLLLLRLLPAPSAVFAHALCVLHPANGMLIGWIANRNASVAALFALLALWLQVRRNQTLPAGMLDA